MHACINTCVRRQHPLPHHHFPTKYHHFQSKNHHFQSKNRPFPIKSHLLSGYSPCHDIIARRVVCHKNPSFFKGRIFIFNHQNLHLYEAENWPGLRSASSRWFCAALSRQLSSTSALHGRPLTPSLPTPVAAPPREPSDRIVFSTKSIRSAYLSEREHTWAIDADARQSTSKLSKTSSSGQPSAFSTVLPL